jgi:Zn finger protein HypA/HybF involved in hydrogenase expression
MGLTMDNVTYVKTDNNIECKGCGRCYRGEDTDLACPDCLRLVRLGLKEIEESVSKEE